MKIGAIIAVNCDEENIWYCLKGIYDFCDEIVVVYSDTTWTGIKQEDGTVDIIDTFPDADKKLKIIKGSFLTQPEQRIVGLNYLKKKDSRKAKGNTRRYRDRTGQCLRIT